MVVKLECLQNMKFYQCSQYGDVKDYFEGPMQILRWMGPGQGNRRVFQGRVQTTSVKIDILKYGHGAVMSILLCRRKVIMQKESLWMIPICMYMTRAVTQDSSYLGG